MSGKETSGLDAQNDSWKNRLKARPVRNAAAEVSRGDGEGPQIKVRRRKPGFLVPPLSWIIRPRLTRRLALDRIGARVWDLCDGERTMEDVVDEFSCRYGLTFHEARVAVSGYVSILVQQGALAIVA